MPESKLEYVICFFKYQKHNIWRMTQGKTKEEILLNFKNNFGKNVLTITKYFVFDRITGEMKEMVSE